ncbi:hypothetical protein ACMFMF_000078 [Clarireedia jacksonii]
MAGSLGLNKRFEEAVKKLVGEDQFNNLHNTRAFSAAVEQFDQSIKTAFRGHKDEDYFVNFPMAKLVDDHKNKLVSNCWNMQWSVVTIDPLTWQLTFYSADLEAIFNPLIADIENLVSDQVNLVMSKRASEDHPRADEIKAIFLVGGFGSSEYLKSRISALHPNIQVIQPHDAWSAIVKGAVLSRFSSTATIVSTQATRHYGVAARAKYDEYTDRGRAKSLDVYGVMRTERMTWYIRRGEDLKRTEKLRFSFYRTLHDDFDDGDLVFKDELLQCASGEAPVHPGPLVKVNCVLKADLTSVDRSSFKKNVGLLGETFWDVHYDLVVEMMPAMMRFSLEIKGKEMGSVTTKYD